MKYGVIRPAAKQAEIVELKDMKAAQIAAGLIPLEVDHGSIGRHLGIVVFEYGLFTPPDKQHYFNLAGKLYAGPAVLYAVDGAGETIDLEKIPPIEFYADWQEVESAIRVGKIERPIMAIDDRIIWQWPDPAPMRRG